MRPSPDAKTVIEYQLIGKRIDEADREFQNVSQTQLFNLVNPDLREEFSDAFRKLERDGCRPPVLFRCLWYFKKYREARLRRAAGKIPYTRARLRNIANQLLSLAKTVNTIETELNVFEAVDDLKDAFARVAERYTALKVPPESADPFPPLLLPVPDMTTKMCEYAALLKAWDPPRIDVSESHGVIAAAVYAEIATGAYHYETIGYLLHSCSCHEFLQLMKESSPGRGKKNSLKEPFPDIRKNADNFRKRFPDEYNWRLNAHLYACHTNEEHIIDPPMDWQGLLTQLERSRQ